MNDDKDEKYECESCGIYFDKGDLDIYYDELLCKDCIAEIKAEIDTPFDS